MHLICPRMKPGRLRAQWGLAAQVIEPYISESQSQGAAALTSTSWQIHMSPGSGHEGILAHQHLNSYYYLWVTLLFLEPCGINTNYDGDQDTCAMRYNRYHFIWMSRKFQGRMMTVKYLFRKLRRRQDQEAHGSLIKKTSVCRMESIQDPSEKWNVNQLPWVSGDHLTPSPGHSSLPLHCSEVGRKWLPGKQRPGPLPPCWCQMAMRLLGPWDPKSCCQVERTWTALRLSLSVSLWHVTLSWT